MILHGAVWQSVYATKETLVTEGVSADRLDRFYQGLVTHGTQEVLVDDLGIVVDVVLDGLVALAASVANLKWTRFC